MFKFVSKRFEAPLFKAETGNEKELELLWGDRVDVTAAASAPGARVPVTVRGKPYAFSATVAGDRVEVSLTPRE